MVILRDHLFLLSGNLMKLQGVGQMMLRGTGQSERAVLPRKLPKTVTRIQVTMQK